MYNVSKSNNICACLFICSIEMYNSLKKLNIPCTLILDSAVGYIMERVDMVMVGAECVVESGGIINKVKFIYII